MKVLFSHFAARRDYRAGDLRDKLGRQWSPPRRNSLEREARDPLPSPRFGKKRCVSEVSYPFNLPFVFLLIFNFVHVVSRLQTYDLVVVLF